MICINNLSKISILTKYLSKFSNQFFGTPLSETEESAKNSDEEVIEPAQVEIIDPEQSAEEKEK